MNESNLPTEPNPPQNQEATLKPKESQDRTRVLVPLERHVYEQIKDNLREFSRQSYSKVTVPRFLSRVIKYNWQEDMEQLRALDQRYQDYMKAEEFFDI